MPKGVLFDFDGTLLNNLAIRHAAVCKIFDHCNVTRPTLEDFYLNCVPPFDTFFDDRGITMPFAQRQAIYWEAEQQHTAELFDDVVAVLNAFQTRGYFLGVITAKTHKIFRNESVRLKIFSRFHFIMTDCYHKADAILEVCVKHRTQRTNVWYVGDGIKDMTDAAEAEVKFAHVIRGIETRGCHDRFGKHYCFKSLTEFKQLVLGK